MHKDRTDPDGMIVHEFDWSGLLQEARSEPKARGRERSSYGKNASNGTGRAEWYGTKTYAEAMDQLLHGWREGADRIAPLAAKLMTRVGAHLSRTNFRNVPDEPGVLDLGAYFAGVPECWTNPETEIIQQQGRLVHILVNGSAACTRDAQQIWAHGAAVCALVRCLELAGQSVRLTWCSVSLGTARRRRGGYGGSSVRIVTTVRVKDYGEPLNIGRAAFVLASPSMLRRIWFRLAERFPIAERRALNVETNGYYGYPGGFSHWHKPPKADIVVDNLVDGSAAEIEAKVLKDLERAGIALRRRGMPA